MVVIGAVVLFVAVWALCALIGGGVVYAVYWLLVAPAFGLTYYLTYWQAVTISLVVSMLKAGLGRVSKKEA